MTNIRYCILCNSIIPPPTKKLKKIFTKVTCVQCKKNSKKKYDKERYLTNKDQVIINVKEYAKKNKNKLKQEAKKYRSANAIAIKEYLLKYREKYKPVRNAREKERLLNEPEYALKKRLRNNILVYVKQSGIKKTCRTTELLGCTFDEFKKYFESKFTTGMTWELFCDSGKIHIDHIIPVSAFDFTIDEEVHKCFHYTNLQPLWKIDNLIKSNKIINP